MDLALWICLHSAVYGGTAHKYKHRVSRCHAVTYSALSTMWGRIDSIDG